MHSLVSIICILLIVKARHIHSLYDEYESYDDDDSYPTKALLLSILLGTAAANRVSVHGASRFHVPSNIQKVNDQMPEKVRDFAIDSVKDSAKEKVTNTIIQKLLIDHLPRKVEERLPRDVIDRFTEHGAEQITNLLTQNQLLNVADYTLFPETRENVNAIGKVTVTALDVMWPGLEQRLQDGLKHSKGAQQVIKNTQRFLNNPVTQKVSNLAVDIQEEIDTKLDAIKKQLPHELKEGMKPPYSYYDNTWMDDEVDSVITQQRKSMFEASKRRLKELSDNVVHRTEESVINTQPIVKGEKFPRFKRMIQESKVKLRNGIDDRFAMNKDKNQESKTLRGSTRHYDGNTEPYRYYTNNVIYMVMVTFLCCLCCICCCICGFILGYVAYQKNKNEFYDLI